MTDAEIIKALECCAGDDGCDVCPMYKPSSECITELQGKALDLINRLQADKEALIAGQETLQKVLAEKAAEVEKLKNDCFCISNERDAIGDCLNEAVEEAKAEAIKEFAENCKKGLRTGEIIMDKSIRDIIDNLVKEMIGE